MREQSKYAETDDGMEAFEAVSGQNLRDDPVTSTRILRKADATVMPVRVSLSFAFEQTLRS